MAADKSEKQLAAAKSLAASLSEKLDLDLWLTPVGRLQRAAWPERVEPSRGTHR